MPPPLPTKKLALVPKPSFFTPLTKRDLRVLGIGVIFGFATCFIGYSIVTSYLTARVVRQNVQIKMLNDTLDRELPWYKRAPQKIANDHLFPEEK